MKEIKSLLVEYGSKNNRKQGGDRLLDLVGEIEDIENKENSSLHDNDDSEEIKDFIAKEKSEIKDL